MDAPNRAFGGLFFVGHGNVSTDAKTAHKSRVLCEHNSFCLSSVSFTLHLSSCSLATPVKKGFEGIIGVNYYSFFLKLFSYPF